MRPFINEEELKESLLYVSQVYPVEHASAGTRKNSFISMYILENARRVSRFWSYILIESLRPTV